MRKVLSGLFALSGGGGMMPQVGPHDAATNFCNWLSSWETCSQALPGWFDRWAWLFPTTLFCLAIGLLIWPLAERFLISLVREEKGDTRQIRRLRLQSYSTFDEIGEAISKANDAYSKEEIIERLLRAAHNGEFYTLPHHSRMRIKSHPKSERFGGDPPRFYLRDRLGEPESADQYSDGTVVYEANLIRGNLNEDNFNPDGQIMIERGDFARWYRRFRSGRYEKG